MEEDLVLMHIQEKKAKEIKKRANSLERSRRRKAERDTERNQKLYQSQGSSVLGPAPSLFESSQRIVNPLGVGGMHESFDQNNSLNGPKDARRGKRAVFYKRKRGSTAASTRMDGRLSSAGVATSYRAAS